MFYQLFGHLLVQSSCDIKLSQIGYVFNLENRKVDGEGEYFRYVKDCPREKGVGLHFVQREGRMGIVEWNRLQLSMFKYKEELCEVRPEAGCSLSFKVF